MFHHDYQSALIKRGLSRVCAPIWKVRYTDVKCSPVSIRPRFETLLQAKNIIFYYEHMNTYQQFFLG